MIDQRSKNVLRSLRCFRGAYILKVWNARSFDHSSYAFLWNVTVLQFPYRSFLPDKFRKDVWIDKMLYKNWDTQRHCQKAILNMKKKKDRNYYFIDKNVHKAIRFGFCSFFSKHMSAVNVLLHFYTFKLASDRTSGIEVFYHTRTNFL